MDDKRTVLAIDDNVTQLKLYKEILVPKYDLRVVKAASEAMSFINKNSSDIILLDIEMPNITGFEFLKDIRKIPSYAKVPILIVSGNTGLVRTSSALEFLTCSKKSFSLCPETIRIGTSI